MALRIPPLVSPPCPSLPDAFPSASASNGMRYNISPWGLFNNTFHFTESHPLHFLQFLPLHFHFPLAFPLPILCSRLVPCCVLTALRVLLTVAVVIVIAIPTMVPSTAQRSFHRSAFVPPLSAPSTAQCSFHRSALLRQLSASSTAQCPRILPFLTIIILIDYLIPTQCYNGQAVAWVVLPAAWWLNRCSEMIATVI